MCCDLNFMIYGILLDSLSFFASKNGFWLFRHFKLSRACVCGKRWRGEHAQRNDSYWPRCSLLSSFHSVLNEAYFLNIKALKSRALRKLWTFLWKRNQLSNEQKYLNTLFGWPRCRYYILWLWFLSQI